MEDNRLYSCGKRLREIREDLQLSSGEFIEINNFPSEKAYLALENGETEISGNAISQIANQLCIDPKWIKYGDGTKYPIHELTDADAIHFPAEIKTKNPKNVYLCIETKDINILLLLEYNPNKWEIYRFASSLDIWAWIDSHSRIPSFYNMLKKLSEENIGRLYTIPISFNQWEMILRCDIHPKQFRIEMLSNISPDLLRNILEIDKSMSQNKISSSTDWIEKLKIGFAKQIFSKVMQD